MRFLLFYGLCFYPEGGWNDFVGAFSSFEEAKISANRDANSGEWWQIIDLEKLEVVAEGHVHRE